MKAISATWATELLGDIQQRLSDGAAVKAAKERDAAGLKSLTINQAEAFVDRMASVFSEVAVVFADSPLPVVAKRDETGAAILMTSRCDSSVVRLDDAPMKATGVYWSTRGGSDGRLYFPFVVADGDLALLIDGEPASADEAARIVTERWIRALYQQHFPQLHRTEV